MGVNKNPGSRDDNRGKFRGPEPDRFEHPKPNEAGDLRDRTFKNTPPPVGEQPGGDQLPSRDRSSDEYWTGESAATAKARSRAEESTRVLDAAKQAHPNRVTGRRGRTG